MGTQTRWRKYRRNDATAPKFKETLERFVGDLLLAKADDEGTGRLYLSLDKNGFKGDLIPVSYRNFVDVQNTLRALGLIEVRAKVASSKSTGARGTCRSGRTRGGLRASEPRMPL